MVLEQLRGSITRALQQMSNATVVDEKVLKECLNEITLALLQADVQLKFFRDMEANIKSIVNLDDLDLAVGRNTRRIIQQAVFDEMCKLLDPGKPSFAPKKEKPSVIMFVGLQGSGKTTSCAKYAFHHQKKGWRSTLVCADTFRAGAFDQLKQNATKAKIPFYGSYMESDPVKIAVDGIVKFKKENRNLIIVDTSGRHKEEAALFEAMKPDLVILVMDSRIGQAAFDQAQAFKHSVSVGAVIVTKMDGHAKGGGALSAVAATKSPVIFIGTGEHMNDFEVFDVKPFLSRLLGMGDSSEIMEKIQEVESIQKTLRECFTLRSMHDLFQRFLNMESPGQVMSVLQGLGGEKEIQVKVESYMTMMDSMTNQELDSTEPELMSESRLTRIARGSGRQISELMEMQFANTLN